MMPIVEGYYSTLDKRTSEAEALLKKAAQPLTRSLSVRTSRATKALASAAQPIADALAERTTAAQRGMLDFPIPTPDDDPWWCVHPVAGGPGLVVPTPSAIPPAAPPGSQIVGPFATQEAAQAACGYAPPAPVPAAPQGQPAAFPAMPPAPVAPQGDGWECRQQPDGGRFVALHSTPSAVPGTVVIAGPFPDYASANAVCSAPAGPPPPPIPTFPLPPPPPPAPAGWICWTSPDGLTVQVAQQSPGPGWRQTGAPYPTEEDARVACGLQPPAPPPPAVPPPTQPPPATPPPAPLPAPTPLPVEACTLPDAFVGGIPLPGTVEFCAAQDQVLAWFSAAGDAVFQWVLDATDPTAINAALDQLRQQSTGILASTFTAIMVPIAQWINSLTAPIMQRVHDAILCVRDLVTRSMRCNVAQLLALLGLKTVISFVKELRFGTEGATFVVAEATFDIAMGQFEQVLDYLIDYVCPAEIPGEDEAAEAFLRGLISREYYECLMRLHGRAPETWEPFLLARSDRLHPREAIQWVRRNEGSPEEEDDALRRAGYYDGVEAARFRELYDELPTIGDHLEWLRKNVFDDDYVRDFRLMEGFEERFWVKFGKDLRALGMKKENAALHYAAHWLNPSLTQLFELTQRNRPGRVDPAIQFTRDDLLRVMAEQDIGVYFRERLESISHPPPSLTQLMSAYGSRVIDGPEFHARLMDLGYSDSDASLIVESRRLEVARQRANGGAGWGPQSLRLGWAARTVTADFVRERMARLGYSPEEANDLMDRADSDNQARAVKYGQRRAVSESSKCALGAYKVGIGTREDIQSLLEKIGWDKGDASSTLQAIDICTATATASAAVANLKKRYQKGGINEPQTREALAALGIVSERVDTYMASWAAPPEPKSPQIRAAQILRWVGQGLMTPQEAALRLERLGWKGDDRDLQLRAATAQLAQREARAAAEADRTAAQRGRALARLAAEAEVQAKRLQSEVRRATPPSTLQGWYARCVINEPWMRERLMAMGYSGEALEAEVRSAKEARAARAATAQRKGEEPCAGNGQPAPGP
jgi:hypothetical protein